MIVWFTNAHKLAGDSEEPDTVQWQVRGFVQRAPTGRNTGWDLTDNHPLDIPSIPPPDLPAAKESK